MYSSNQWPHNGPKGLLVCLSNYTTSSTQHPQLELLLGETWSIQPLYRIHPLSAVTRLAKQMKIRWGPPFLHLFKVALIPAMSPVILFVIDLVVCVCWSGWGGRGVHFHRLAHNFHQCKDNERPPQIWFGCGGQWHSHTRTLHPYQEFKKWFITSRTKGSEKSRTRVSTSCEVTFESKE